MVHNSRNVSGRNLVSRIDIQEIEGVRIIPAHSYIDLRGNFIKFDSESLLVEKLGNVAISINPRVGTIRGIHFQVEPFAEEKIISCIQGSVFEVVVDLRPNSMSFGRPYILNIEGAIHDGWASISGFSNTLNADYLYHYLSSNTVQNYWSTKINSGSVINLNADIIKTLRVPIPAISKQEDIATLLDKFDALTNSLTEGLPREIELRQKQYEYYRDLLLSFPKPQEVAV
jgi:restriction endonuclease S subunit